MTTGELLSKEIIAQRRTKLEDTTKRNRDSEIDAEKKRIDHAVSGERPIPVDDLTRWIQETDEETSWQLRHSALQILQHRTIDEHIRDSIAIATKDRSKRVRDLALSIAQTLVEDGDEAAAKNMLPTNTTLSLDEHKQLLESVIQLYPAYGIQQLLKAVRIEPFVTGPASINTEESFLGLFGHLLCNEFDQLKPFLELAQRKERCPALFAERPWPFSVEDPMRQRVIYLEHIWCLQEIREYDMLQLFGMLRQHFASPGPIELYQLTIDALATSPMKYSKIRDLLPLHTEEETALWLRCVGYDESMPCRPESKRTTFQHINDPDEARKQLRHHVIAKALSDGQLPPLEGLSGLYTLLAPDWADSITNEALKTWDKQVRTLVSQLEEQELILVLRDMLSQPLRKRRWKALCQLLEQIESHESIDMICDYVDMHIHESNRVHFTNQEQWLHALLQGRPSPFFRLVRTLHFRYIRNFDQAFLHKLFQSPKISHITQINACEHLHGMVSIDDNPYDTRTSIINAICASPHLQHVTHLNLSNHRATQEQMAQLAQSQALPSLTSLSLGQTYLDDNALLALRDAPFVPQLRYLNLKGNKDLTIDSLRELLPHLTSIEHIVLKDCHIWASELESLATHDPQNRDWLSIFTGYPHDIQ
jgi:hypothetical protein